MVDGAAGSRGTRLSFPLGCVMDSSTAPTTGPRSRRSAKPEVRTGSFSNGISYDAIGTGPRSVVFLPGGPGMVPMAWKRIARTLLEPLAAGGCTVWRLTRRRDMPAGHSLADMADDVATVIDEAFGGRVDAVVGLSMGGMIAQFLAARHPDAMGRVVLLSAAATPTAATFASTRREGEAWGHGRYTEAGAAMFEDVLPGDRLGVVRRLLGVPMGRMLAKSASRPDDVLVETAAVMDVDTRPVLPRITAPVLLIFGDKDTSFAPDIVEETARLIPACTLVRYSERGHGGAAWDERTPGHVLDFIGGADPGAKAVRTTGGGTRRSPIKRVRESIDAGLQKAFWNWAGVPSGPLGWISSRTVLWSGSYPAVAEALQLRPQDELLELGCGSAGFLAGQAARVRRVAGIDLSDIQVDLARRRLAKQVAAGTAEIVKGDAAALPWPDGAFTVVTCMSVFEAFPDPKQVMREALRVLRPGGRAVLNIGERVAEGTKTHQGWAGIPIWAEEDVRRMVEEAGFADVTIQYVPWGEPTPVNRLFAKIVGPIGGDLRLASGIKP